MAIDEFSLTFEKNIPSLRSFLLGNLKTFQSQTGFRSVWEDFEDRIISDTQKYLQRIFPDLKPQNIVRATSKSVFPELKITFKGNVYAVDVKSGEDTMNPWYDMGRLDTFEERHLKRFKNEYYITVKWHRDQKGITIVDLFIEPFYKSVGLNSNCGGVKYRPYDGKLRPKSWEDFENQNAYWHTIEEFREGLRKSKGYRRIEMIAGWYKEMSASERATFRKLIQGNEQSKLL